MEISKDMENADQLFHLCNETLRLYKKELKANIRKYKDQVIEGRIDADELYFAILDLIK